MGPFIILFGFKYILVVHDYFSEGIGVMPIENNEGRIFVYFLKGSIFACFLTPREIISGGGSPFAIRGFQLHLIIWSTK